MEAIFLPASCPAHWGCNFVERKSCCSILTGTRQGHVHGHPCTDGVRSHRAGTAREGAVGGALCFHSMCAEQGPPAVTPAVTQHGSREVAVRYQVTHEMMAEPVPGLPWSFPKSIRQRRHQDWHDQGRLLTASVPRACGGGAGWQAQWRGARSHSVPEREITFDSDSNHTGSSSSSPSPSLGPSLPLLGCFSPANPTENPSPARGWPCCGHTASRRAATVGKARE